MKALLLAAGLLALGGCSSVYDLFGGTEHGPQAMGGTRTWPADLTPVFPARSGCAGTEYIFCYILEGLIDLPCSLAGDVALLPVTVWFEIFR